MQVCKNGERALLNAKWGLAAYRILLPLLGAVPADPEPTPLRLVRGCIAMPFTADVRVHVVAPPGTLMPSTVMASSAT